MGKKRASSLPLPRQLLMLRSKLFLAMCVVLCLFAFLALTWPPNNENLSVQNRSSSINTEDRRPVEEAPPKVAFLFLVRRNLPLDFLWGTFFQEAGNSKNFSIYVHSEPGFVFNERTTLSSFFEGRQLNNSVKVEWGGSSMIEAERSLLKAALQDPANQRFVLLSDSCAPLYTFSYIYKYLISSTRSYVDSFFDLKDGRYNPDMSSVVPKDKWRKGSQWFALIRRHAQLIADDNVVYPIFKEFCKRRHIARVGKGKQISELHKLQDCIPDEHYVQTLLAMSGLDDGLARRSLTYTLWNQSTSGTKQPWHPVTFDYADACPQKIKEIKEIREIFFEAEQRTEWCQIDGAYTPCFLFARKFTRGAAARLLYEGIFGPFDPLPLLKRTH